MAFGVTTSSFSTCVARRRVWGAGAALALFVQAVAIDSRASRVTLALARAVQDAASVADGLPLPLLEYNPGNAAAPFRVLRALPAG